MYAQILVKPGRGSGCHSNKLHHSTCITDLHTYMYLHTCMGSERPFVPNVSTYVATYIPTYPQTSSICRYTYVLYQNWDIYELSSTCRWLDRITLLLRNNIAVGSCDAVIDRVILLYLLDHYVVEHKETVLLLLLPHLQLLQLEPLLIHGKRQ